MQARYYDPVLGRFLSNDPVGFSVDQPQMFGRYTYSLNYPVNLVDPDGRMPASVADRRFIGGSQAVRANPQAATAVARAVGGVAVDFTPVVGDIKGIGDAVANPTPVNIAAAAVGLIPAVGDVAAAGLKNGKKFGDARFVTDANGQTVDLDTTSVGSFDQPNGGRTDILQSENHGAGTSHTHQPELNTRPDTGETFINGLDGGQPVTKSELDNIQNGTAPRSDPKGR